MFARKMNEPVSWKKDGIQSSMLYNFEIKLSKLVLPARHVNSVVQPAGY